MASSALFRVGAGGIRRKISAEKKTHPQLVHNGPGWVHGAMWYCFDMGGRAVLKSGHVDLSQNADDDNPTRHLHDC